MRKSANDWPAVAAAVAILLGVAACSGEPREHVNEAGEHAAVETGGEHAMAETGIESSEGGEHSEHSEAREGGGEHGESHGEGGEEGEESGVYLGIDETWDVVRRGARLVLAFESASNAFVGTVANTTSETLCAVRVEVHLSTGTELGPTERTDVRAGQSTAVRLPTAGEAFDSWTAHPELSACSGG